LGVGSPSASISRRPKNRETPDVAPAGCRDDLHDVTGEEIDKLFAGSGAGPLFLLESYWPDISAARVAAADIETARALGELGDDRPAARHLGSLLVPDDELLLRFFAGGSAELISAANTRGGVPVERVVGIVALPQAGAKR
jgi:hypothetical protein